MKNKTLLQSFKNALNGICRAFSSERNMKIHALAALLVILAGVLLGLDSLRWMALITVIGLVFICELINTAVEKLTDMVTNEYSEQAKIVKDISAAAVLVSALLSVVIGIFVFIDPILLLLGQL